jgi:3-phenylpropionate/cinnamic acid dioxygenase small subunit
MSTMTLNEILADALHSHYINDAYYAKLRGDLTEWAQVGTPLTEQERQRYESVILHEHWLLDRQAFEDWYQLYTKECVYWIPSESTINAIEDIDPQRHVTEAFDDRRRMADRIVWLRTGIASSQLPKSHTAHISSGFVRIPSDVAGEVKIRSQFVLHEIRGGHPIQTVCGWMGHVLVEQEGTVKIDRKLVSLLDANRARHNPTYLI